MIKKGAIHMSRDVLTMNHVDPIDFNVIRIPSLPVYDREDYDFYDDKDIDKYIKDVERVARNSFEYHRFIKFLRTRLDMNKCSFYENVSNRFGDTDCFKIKIHIHHDPFTLYEIAKIVYLKRAKRHENLDEQLTACEVMLLHYNLLVGLIPLAETVHELVHNQYLFVPTTSVFGFYRDFMEMYDEYIDQELKDKIERLEEFSALYEGEDKFILDKHFLYTDLSGTYKLPKYEDVKAFLNERISEIDNGLPSPHVEPKPVKKLVDPPWKIVID